MANYAPSTRARIGDLILGMRVDTGNLLATTYLDHSPAVHNTLWTVSGTILLMNLFLEITTVLPTAATTVRFEATFSTPSATVQPLGTKCTTISDLAVGHRIVWGGGILATAATLTTQPAISDFAAVTPIIVGSKDGLGTIGTFAEAASCGSGAMFGSLFYVPMSEGAYVEALV